jgi:hypothetical protein
MKKSELKEKLRPIVEELMRESFVKFIREGLIEDTVKDMVLEGGVLKSIVAEVAQGMQAAPIMERRDYSSNMGVGSRTSQQVQHQQQKQFPSSPQNNVLSELEREKEEFKKNFRLDHTQNQFIPEEGNPKTFQQEGALARLKNNPMFEGTAPLRDAGTPAINNQYSHKPHGQRLRGSGENATIDVLGDVSPDDPGVDIRKFLSNRTETSWIAHAENISKKN